MLSRPWDTDCGRYGQWKTASTDSCSFQRHNRSKTKMLHLHRSTSKWFRLLTCPSQWAWEGQPAYGLVSPYVDGLLYRCLMYSIVKHDLNSTKDYIVVSLFMASSQGSRVPGWGRSGRTPTASGVPSGTADGGHHPPLLSHRLLNYREPWIFEVFSKFCFLSIWGSALPWFCALGQAGTTLDCKTKSSVLLGTTMGELDAWTNNKNRLNDFYLCYEK